MLSIIKPYWPQNPIRSPGLTQLAGLRHGKGEARDHTEQHLATAMDFHSNRPLVDLWMIYGSPCGMGTPVM